MKDKENEQELEREEDERKFLEMERKRSFKIAENKERDKEEDVLMDLQNEVENNVVIVHKARKKASNPSSSVTSSRSVSPVPVNSGPLIPTHTVCISLQSSQKIINGEHSKSNRELLLLQRKQGGADRRQSNAEQSVGDGRQIQDNRLPQSVRNKEVEGGTMDSDSITIHRPLSHNNNRVKNNQNTTHKNTNKSIHKHKDDECPTYGEGGSDVDALADSLVPNKSLQFQLAFFGTKFDGVNT